MTAPSPSPHRHELIAAIDRCLPQTQCGKCDYPDCIGYARGIADGEADINQCPPGGGATIRALAKHLGREVKPLNPNHGNDEEQPLRLAFIREEACIGCKLCIDACPVDCIVGAVKLMHTVIADECTGCELCLPVCPTDCIELVEPAAAHAGGEPSLWSQFSRRQVEQARRRAQQKRERVAEQSREKARKKTVRRRAKLQQEIAAAVQRWREKKSQQS